MVRTTQGDGANRECSEANSGVGNQGQQNGPKGRHLTRTPQSQQRPRVTLPTLACGQLTEGTKGWPGIASPSFCADSYLR